MMLIEDHSGIPIRKAALFLLRPNPYSISESAVLNVPSTAPLLYYLKQNHIPHILLDISGILKDSLS